MDLKSSVVNNFYYYIFYRISLFTKKVNKKDNDYMFTALIALSVLFGMNVLTIYFLIKELYGIKLNIKIAPLIIMGAIYGLNYHLLMRDNMGAKIRDYFDSEHTNKKQSHQRTILLILYILLTFTICGVVAYITKYHLL